MYLVTDLTGIWFRIKSKYGKLIKKFLKENGAVKEAEWKKYSKKARIGKISYKEALTLWLRDCGIKNVKTVARKFISFENKIWKNVLIFYGKDVLKFISKKVKIIALTDSPHSAKWVRKILKIGKIDKYFYKVYSSHDLKMEKPKSFKYLLKKFGNFVFLGHDDDEILGAKKLGIKTIGLKNENADIVIKSLKELKKLLDK